MNVPLEERTRCIAILATLMGCQGKELFMDILPEALEAGVTPVEIKEVLYQAVAYLGIGKVYPFFEAVNKVFKYNNIALPLAKQGTTTPENRIRMGNQVQIDAFGEVMRGYENSGPEETRHINRWLAGNCFGDYYTRNGLTLSEREMITFCYIAAQGGCEPQLTAHAMGNMNVGNDKQFLITVISNCMPYIGYPRTLNAINCINNAAASLEMAEK